jgi:hypothetical protein
VGRSGFSFDAPTLLVAVAVAFGPAAMASAQGSDTQAQAGTEAPRQAPARPRPRPTDPRDRAFMDGGMPSNPGFSGFGQRQPAPATPQAELAPRPNMDMEYREPQTDPPPVATVSPTLINPALPGRGAAADGAVHQRERRLLNNPAAGARFSVPMTW